MPKIILPIVITIITTQLALAVQCPSVADWTHVKGQEWQLSAAAKAEGWQPITLPDAIESDLTRLPDNTYVLVGIEVTERKFTSCGYALKRGEHDNVIVALNTQDAVDIKNLPKPPFQCRAERCFCETVAGDPEKCVWEWK